MDSVGDNAKRSSDGPRSRPVNYFSADFALRLLLLASSVAGIAVILTSKQSARVPIPVPPFLLPRTAQFDHSPGITFLFAEFIAAAAYSLATMIVSATAVRKTSPSTQLLLSFIISDVIMAGMMAAATGTAGGVAYIGLKGNSHVNWNKICGVFDKFCRHIGSAVGFGLISSIALVLLVVLSAFSLQRRSN